jgi:hypothetical protein
MNAINNERETESMTKRGEPPAGYYTASLTRRRLGNISDGMLRTYVQKGRIDRLVPPGRLQGFYKREDVERLARELDGLGEPMEVTGTHFERATKEDMPECVDLLINVFGGGNTVERRQRWIEQNPEIGYVVRSRSKIVGCAFVLPLAAAKIEAIFGDQSSASIASIEPEDIQPLLPGIPAYLYAVSVGVKATTTTAKRARGQVLVRGLLEMLYSLARRGVAVKLIAARSETRDGINLLRHIGFTEIESRTSNRNFVIEVERSGIPHIMEYKRILAESQIASQ